MSNFEYFNPNPLYRPSKNGKQKRWHIGDCAVRAICKATGMSWVSAYRFASESALKAFEPFNCIKGFEQVMKDLGFKRVSYANTQSREKVRDFAANHADEVCILRLSSHFVCCANGKYHDVWDCGSKTAYCYYVKS